MTEKDIENLMSLDKEDLLKGISKILEDECDIVGSIGQPFPTGYISGIEHSIKIVDAIYSRFIEKKVWS